MKRTVSVWTTVIWVTAHFALVAGGASAATVFVDANNPNCPGSGTALDPFCLVQDGIVAAVPGDTVLVAPGTYTETLDFLGKAILVTSSAGPSQTIINAGGAGSVVVFRAGEGPDSVLQGFTLTGGWGTVATIPTGFTATVGGGVFCQGSSPTIENNIIEKNPIGSSTGGTPPLPIEYGGGIYCDQASPIIRGNVITGHWAHDGSGIMCWQGSNALIEDNQIEDNYALNLGGGIAICDNSAATVRNNVIRQNQSSSCAGIWCDRSDALIEGNEICGNYADEGEGGGLCLNMCDAVVRDNEICHNLAVSEAGGISVSNGSPEITGNRIVMNTAPSGGGMSCRGDSGLPLMTHNLIQANDPGVSGYAGGIYVACPVALRFNTFLDNGSSGLHVDFSAGSIGIQDSVFSGNSVGIEVEGGVAQIERCTFEGNQFGSVSVFGGTANIVGSILWNSSASSEVFLAFGGAANVSHSDVRGGYPGMGNLALDPLFVNAPVHDYRLQIGSPCLDVGDPAAPLCDFDLQNRSRRTSALGGGGLADMGAMEFSHIELAVSGSASPGGNLIFETSGTPAQQTFLFVGLDTGATCLAGHGTLGLDLTLPWILVALPASPGVVPVLVPAHMAPQFVFQAASIYNGGNVNLSQYVVVPVP